MLSFKEVAEELGVSEATVRRLVANKRIGAVRIGWQWRIREEELGRVRKQGITPGKV